MGVPLQLQIISSALILFHAAVAVIHARQDCPSQSCGNHPFLVRFPFRLLSQAPSQSQKQQQQHPSSSSCGYPGFDLTCIPHAPWPVLSLNLPHSGHFWLRNINYLMQQIQLYDPHGCLPRRLLTLNLSSSPFISAAAYSRNFTFLSCPPGRSIPTSTRFTTVDCLSNSTVSILATSSMELTARSDIMDVCSSLITLPIPVISDGRPQDHDEDDHDWLSSLLSQDLHLTWNAPDCQACETRQGVCGFENSSSDQISCFTNPPTGQSRGLQIFKIIALSIVIPAITCSICISCFTCTVERRAARNSATAAVAPPPPLPAAAITGLDESIIESYKKVVLGESRRLPGPNGATCPICLGDYHPNDTVRCIPQCEHCFHSDCIDEWLKLNSSCPVCRNSPPANV